MEPLTMIATTLVAGAAAALKDTATQVVKDAYTGIKELIKRKLGGASNAEDLNSALRLAEKKPDDPARLATLKDELESAGANNDSDVLKAAQGLLELIKQQAPAVATQYNLTVQGSGAAAGTGARAVGAGGVIVEGNTTGGINTGTQTTHNYYGQPSADPAGAAGTGLVASAEGRKVYQLLNDYFTMSNIEGLCFEMGIDEENLRGETKAGKSRALVQHVETTGRLDELKKLMRAQRSNLRSQLQ